MADYYLDATLANNGDGTTKTNAASEGAAGAFNSLQKAIDSSSLTPGDVLWCRHTQTPDETLSAKVDVDNVTIAGAFGVIPCKFVGVNTSWVEDGTKYELDGNGVAGNCLDFSSSSVDYTTWKHFSFTGATSHGVDCVTGSNGHMFIDCIAHTNGERGLSLSYNSYGKLVGCLAYENGNEGISFSGNFMAFCCCRDNTEEGATCSSSSPLIYSNLFYGNGKHGLALSGTRASVINNVFDGNTWAGLSYSSYQVVALGNRFTNNDLSGIDANTQLSYSGHNYFQDNTTGDFTENTLDQFDFFNFTTSTDTNVVGSDEGSGGDALQGYTSLTSGSEDYNLDEDATNYSIELNLLTGL